MLFLRVGYPELSIYNKTKKSSKQVLFKFLLGNAFCDPTFPNAKVFLARKEILMLVISIRKDEFEF
jgi:hypothetical protein